MAKHPAKCPKCGGLLQYESAVDEKIVCPACQVLLSVPGKVKPSDKVDPLLGQTLGEFVIEELLGRGGMGAVYKAKQPALGRFVAVKVLPRRLAADANFIERFQREARAAAAISHPNIIQVLTVGQDKGHQFIAMEFVEGESLADVLKRQGPLPVDRALDLFKQITAALAKAHSAGIVHRDIKPANILLTADGHAKLADFGLAKRTDVDVSVTQTGAMMGTPLYFPPEAGRGERYDARSDLYSLGATFYHLIAGRPPFQGNSPTALAIKHANDPVPSLREAAPDTPMALCGIVQRLLQKNAAQRFQTADELLAALNRVTVGEAPVPNDAERTMTVAGPHHVSVEDRRAAKAQARKKLLIIGGAAAAVVLVLVVALVLVLRRGPREQGAHVAQPPAAVGIPSPTPTTDSPTESNAETVFRNAQVMVGRLNWEEAQTYLDRLHTKYGKSAFHASKRTEIEALQAKVTAILNPQATPPKPEPPKPEPKKEEPPKPEPKKEEPPKPEPKTTAKEDEDAKKAAQEEKQREAEAARRDAVVRAEGAYAEQSEKVWALFKERKYDEADKLLANLVGGASLPRERLLADQQALALLKDFWPAVGAGLATTTGKFLMVARAAGNLEEVKDGVIRIRTAKGEIEERPLTQLAGKQALYYFRQASNVAQPPPAVQEKTQPRPALSPAEGAAVPHQELMAGVFLLAEGTALDEAAAALDKAGDEPSVAIYNDRLNALKMGATEVAAQKAWLSIQDEAKGKITPGMAKRLTDLLAAFDKQHGQTKLHKGLAKDLAELKTRIEDSLGYTQWPFDEKEAKRRQKATAEALGVKTEQDVDLGNGVKMTFVLIPAGEFLMGSLPTTSTEKLAAAYGGDPKEYEGEFPQHRVKISRPFWMAKYEVTQEQWFAVFQTNPSRLKDKRKNPVESVDWNQAHGFAKELSEKLGRTFRLPTEAEWEYACRAGTATEFYFGNDAAKIPDFGWQGVGSTAPVGMKKPNAWGLCDMAGNVWEWVEDWHGKYEAGAQTDPKGAPAGGRRVLRGGCWDRSPGVLRSAFRRSNDPGGRLDFIGFRVVLAP